MCIRDSFREIPEFLKVLGFENGYYDENNHEWVTEFLPSEDLTHSNGSIVQGGFVTGMLDAAMAQCIMFKSNGEDLPLTLDIDVKFLNSCIPDHKVTSRAKIIKQGKSIVFTSANLFQKDDLIATASASNKIIKFKL